MQRPKTIDDVCHMPALVFAQRLQDFTVFLDSIWYYDFRIFAVAYRLWCNMSI
jgi:hypothetical protein